jgi:hypothetical protein
VPGLLSAFREHLGPRRRASVKRWFAPAIRGDLTRLGRFYGTDKASPKHLYTPFYEEHLRHLKRERIHLLEIGIGGYDEGPGAGGGSLRMWRTWLPRAHIVGIDLGPRDFREPRITTVVGDQADRAFLTRLAAEQGPFKVVIDDGSHVSEHVRITFETLWPLLPAGGIYAIEDLATSYLEGFGGGPPGTAGTSVEMLKDLVDATQLGDIAQMHLYPQLAVLVKGRCPMVTTDG